MTKREILRVRDLCKSYKASGRKRGETVQALSDFSMSIAQGEAVALVGESGSGKSTVARLVSGLERADSGEIQVLESLSPSDRKTSMRFRKAVQMIFQDPFGSLNPVHSIRHHIERPLVIHKEVNSDSESKERATIALLEEVGLSPAQEFLDKRPFHLSGGQRQRVAIARALAPKPKLLLADEPTSMLDVSIRAGILQLLKKQKEEGIAILYITHDLASARFLADRVFVMFKGRVVESGRSEEILERPQHDYTKLLLSALPHPEENIMDVTLNRDFESAS